MTTTKPAGFLSGVDDFLGSVLNSNLGQAATQYMQLRGEAEIAKERAKAEAAAIAAQAKAAAVAAQPPPSGAPASGMPSTQTMLIIGAAALGLLAVVFIARSSR